MAKKTIVTKDLTAEFYPKKQGEPGEYQFRDASGVVGEDVFYAANDYVDGFAKVKLDKASKFCYRDLIGQVSAEKTEVGKLLNNFFKGAVNVDALKGCDFNNPNLQSFVVMTINLRHLDEFLKAKDDSALKLALESYNKDENHKYFNDFKAKAEKKLETKKTKTGTKTNKPKQ